MNRYLTLLSAVASVTLVACAGAPRHPEFSNGYPIPDCPDQLSGQVKLEAEARPIELNAAALRDDSIATTGSLGRRLLVSVVPNGLRPEDRIVWSTLTVASYGGTFLGWDGLHTASHPGEPRSGRTTTASEKTQRDELVSVALSPGQVKIVRTARGRKDLSGMHSIDLLIMPGGIVVNDSVVRIPQLWRDDGTPLAATVIAPELVPMRHPPGLDTVQASMQLDFIVRLGQTGDEWSCSAESRVTLVDQDSLRQPFWDIGLASSNSGRQEWLALFDPALGAVRLVFDNPLSAHSLASWMRATGSTRVGPYGVTVFRQPSRAAGRPFGSIDEAMLQTLRPMTAEDLRRIVIGPAGEP